MKRIVGYRLVQRDDVSFLEHAVNEYLNDGWILWGTTQTVIKQALFKSDITKTVYCQAMVKSDGEQLLNNLFSTVTDESHNATKNAL